MIHERLDHGCRARILGVYANRVLINAFWRASGSDRRNFLVNADGIAHNTVEVSREYFTRKYGEVL